MKDKISVDVDSTDIFLSVLLICCAWGKVSWAWFWLVILLLIFGCVGKESKFHPKEEPKE